MNFFYQVDQAGSQFAKSSSERRGIILSNQSSLILTGLSFILFIMYYYWYGWNFITLTIPVASVLCLFPILLNAKGFNTLSRFWVCLFIPVVALAVSVYAKIIYFEQQQELDYFTFRFIILASCVFPFILFSLKEKTFLIISSFCGLLILLLHDPIHSFFHVGYHMNARNTLVASNYYFTNVVVFLTYDIMMGGLIFLKWISEKNEDQNVGLIHQLNLANLELKEKNTEIEAQSIELMAQSEVLNINQQKLQETYEEIEEHKNYLFRQNKDLTYELLEKNKELIDTNTELIKHNNELRQFSYTVSHNLRGPVASLLGLNHLIDVATLDDANQVVISHFKKAVAQLDTIIHDLGKIIDIRHDIFKIRQKINLENEIKKITQILKKEIDTHHVNIYYNFDRCPDIYSVKPMVHSILYNLVSNGIKYRSLDRPAEIYLTVFEDPEHFIISVKDNGLGIDLNRNKENLFKLYKRFHYHTEGKGLGLYLVKLQCEALGGKIQVTSELNKFTNFTVYLRKPENIQMQILYNEPYACIFYDAKTNATGVKWNGPISSEQYRSVFNRSLEFLKAYNTPSWISDISEQGPIATEDQHWMFHFILPEAVRNGLKRIVAIKPGVNNQDGIKYLEEIKSTTETLGISQGYFTNFEEAFNWVMDENEKAAIKNDEDDGGIDSV